VLNRKCHCCALHQLMPEARNRRSQIGHRPAGMVERGGVRGLQQPCRQARLSSDNGDGLPRCRRRISQGIADSNHNIRKAGKIHRARGHFSRQILQELQCGAPRRLVAAVPMGATDCLPEL